MLFTCSTLAVLSVPVSAAAQSPGSSEQSTEPTLAQELSSTPVRGQSGVSLVLGLQVQDGRTETIGWTINGIATHTTQRRQMIRFDLEATSAKYRPAAGQPLLHVDNDRQIHGLFLQPIRPRLSGIGLGDWRRDTILGLDYRAAAGVGLGLHVIETRKMNMFLAPTFEVGKEHRSHTDVGDGVLDFGFLQSFVGQVTPVLSIEEWFQTSVDTQESDDKASAFNISALAKVAKHVSLKIYYKHQYDSLVPPGTSNLQREFGSAIVVAFARPGEAAKKP